SHRLAQRPARDVLVGDVDVRWITRQSDDSLAASVAERSGGSGLPLGAVARLALAGNDLQRDVQPAPLVTGEPDVAHASGAERPDRPVAAGKRDVLFRPLGHVPGL